MKHIYTSIKQITKTPLLLAFFLLGMNGNAWGYYQSTVKVYSAPDKGGKVYVGKNSSCSASNCTKTSAEATIKGGRLTQTSGNNTFYLCNNPSSGYEFKGWATSENASSGDGVNSNPYTKSVSGSSATFGGTTHTFYAIFSPKQYTITLNNQGADSGKGGTASISVTFDASTNLTKSITKPQRTNYTFGGYYTAENGGGVQIIDANGNVLASKSDGSTTYTDGSKNWKYPNNLTLYAKWYPNYSVAFNSNGGTGSMTNQEFVSGTAQNLKSNDFTRTGYTFAGWATSASGAVAYNNQASYNNTNATAGSTVTLYAKWTPITYTIIFNGNGNTEGSMSNQTFQYDEQKSLTSNDFSKKYTVTFDANGGTSDASSLTSTYTFAGWATSAGGDVVYTNAQSIKNLSTTNNATINLYAKWTGGSITLPSGSTSNEYEHLEGWYMGNLATKVGGANSVYTPTDNVTLKAKWTIEMLNPTFEGANTELNVGDAQSSAFVLTNVKNPEVHIEVIEIDDVNDGSGKVIAYDAATNTIHAVNAGKATIYFEQKATGAYNAGTSATWTYIVTKKEPNFVLGATELVIDQTTTLTLTNTSNAQVTIAPQGRLSYDPETGIVQGVTAGDATITIAQAETNAISGRNEVLNVKVVKKTPNLNVIMDNVVRTSMSLARGRTASVRFDTNSDGNVTVSNVSGAQYVSLADGVMTAGVAGKTATYKVTVSETDTYKEKSQEFSLTVTENTSHLPVSGKTYNLGYGDEFDWRHQYTTLQFSGIPDKLTFKYKYNYKSDAGKPSLTCPDYIAWMVDDSKEGGDNAYMMYIEESADGNKWDYLWSDSDPFKDQTKSVEKQLKKDTRYVRFHHSANFASTYSEVAISELKYVQTPDPENVDFGAAVINSNTITKTTKVNWCNVAPLTVTSSDERISVSPATFGDFEKYSTQILTLSYKPSSAEETVNATITLSNGDNTYKRTIPVTAATVRREQTITWDANLAATGFAMNVGEQYPDVNVLVVASVNNGGRITFTSADANKIEVISDTALLAKGVGKVKIAAHQAGDAEFQAVHDTVEFTVTELRKQSITWNQNLRGLLTTSDTVHLNAKATSGMKITYTSGNTNVVKIINDNVLKVVGEGKTYITATQAGGKDADEVEWLGVSHENYAIVRNPASQCEELALSEGSLTLKDGEKTYNLSGIPEALTFVAKHGTKSGAWGAGVSYDPLIVEQYATIDNIDGWYPVYSKVVETSETQSGIIAIDESATKIRFKTGEKGTDHTIKNINVTRKMFVRADVNSIDAEVETDAIWSQDIIVTHSNIDMMSISSKKNILSFSAATLGEGCSGYGDDVFTVSFTPKEKYSNNYDTIVITDGKATNRHTIEIPVHLYSKGLTQVLSDFNAPATALSTDANIALSATTTSNLPIRYATSDTTKARIVNDNELEIVAAGTITVYAIQAGNAKYDSVAVEKTLVISKVTPVIAENERPTADNVRYNGTWDNALLNNGTGKARVTWHGVADAEVDGRFEWSENIDETITVIPNTYNRSVTFKPTDSGRYNDVTFTMPVNVLRAQSVIAVDNKTLIVSLPGEDVSFDLGTLVTENAGGGDLTFDFVSEVNDATINNSIFTPTTYGEYIIRATIAQTEYYTSETADFTVSVIEGILFDGTNGSSLTADDPIIINSDVTIGNGESVEVKALTINGGNTLTIANGGMLTVGDDNSFARASYGDIIVEAGGKLILSEGQVQVNDFTLYSGFENEQPKSGEVFNQQQITTNGKAYFILDLDPSGEASAGWYTFTVPFPVDELRGITRKAADGSWATIVNEKNYAIMAFYENLRTTTKNGWKKYTGTLQPGQAYTMTIDSKINTYRFEMQNSGTFAEATDNQTLKASDGAKLDRGWNGLGNGTMRYINIAGAPVVQMYIHDGNHYLPANASNAFAVGAAYFIQTQTNDSLLNLNAVGDPGTILRAPQRESQTAGNRFSVELTAAGKICDRMFVTCDDEASAEYVIGKDVQKMGATTGTKYATMCANAKGAQLCAVNAAYSGNQAIVPLQFFSPSDAEYMLSLGDYPSEDVYLTRDGVVVWDLTISDYTLDLTAGTDNSYALLVIRHAQNTATGIDQAESENNNGTDFVKKMIVDGQLFILREGVLYDAQGNVVSGK